MAYQCNDIKLDKGMYQEAGRTFTQVLERQDPSEQYKGTPMEGLDAFQRQLKRFDIKVKGAGSDVVDKFFATSQSAVLFPEYIARAVKTGMEAENVLPQITATETVISGMDYRSITSEGGQDEHKLRRVDEGAAIPQTTVKTRDTLVKLNKRGRMLVASYEAIRFQKLDLFSVTLRQIGAQIGRMHLEDAIDVIVNGDGNDNAAAVTAAATSGTLTYDGLLEGVRPLPAEHPAHGRGHDGEAAEAQPDAGQHRRTGFPRQRQAGDPHGRPGPALRRRTRRQDHRSGQKLRPGTGEGR